MRNLLKFISITLILFVVSCSQRDTSDRETQNNINLILFNALQASPGGLAGTPAQRACGVMVFTANNCIAQGYGFNPAQVCNAQQVGTTTATTYNTATSCLQRYTQVSACNLNHNKAANAQTFVSTSLFGTSTQFGVSASVVSWSGALPTTDGCYSGTVSYSTLLSPLPIF